MMDDESGDERHGDLFNSSVLDSLNRLADEIHEDLRSDDNSAGHCTGSYNSDDDDYDEGEYSDDDEDPDSGETQLFSMMDDLVMQLQMELKQVGEEGGGDETETLSPAKVDSQAIREVGQQEAVVKTMSPPSPLKENAENLDVTSTEPSDVLTQGLVPPLDCTNLPHISSHNSAEKQIRLHQHVKSLLRRVSDLASPTSQDGARRNLGDDYSTASKEEDGSSQNESAPQQNEEESNLWPNSNTPVESPRGDSSADRLERLMGAISNYSKARDPSSLASIQTGHGVILGQEPTESTNAANAQVVGVVEATDELPGTASDAYEQPAIIGEAGSADDDGGIESTSKTRAAMSIYTQRKRREYLLRKKSPEEEISGGEDLDTAQNVADGGEVDRATVNPRRSKTSRDLATETTQQANPQAVQRVESQSTANGSSSPRQRQPSHPRQRPNNLRNKEKRRTNKHKKRRPQRDVLQGTGGLVDVVPEPAESFSQQSLRKLLSTLRALDAKLSKETARTAV